MFTAAWEFPMEGSPEAIRPIIESEAAFFRCDNHRFVTVEQYSDPGRSHWWTHLVAQGPDRLSYHIGVIELQELPRNRTLLRIPAFERWDKRFGFDYPAGLDLFTAFLECLLSELQRLGFCKIHDADDMEARNLGFRLPHQTKVSGDQ